MNFSWKKKKLNSYTVLKNWLYVYNIYHTKHKWLHFLVATGTVWGSWWPTLKGQYRSQFESASGWQESTSGWEESTSGWLPNQRRDTGKTIGRKTDSGGENRQWEISALQPTAQVKASRQINKQFREESMGKCSPLLFVFFLSNI